MKKLITITAVLTFALSIFATQGSHVFWYNAVTNGYNVSHSYTNTQDEAAGPAISGADILVYEGMIATGAVFQASGNVNASMAFGNSSSGKGGCGFIWSKDLNEMTGTATSALVRAEYRDGFSGDPFNVSGTMNIKVAVIDYQGNVDGTWGDRADVAETAQWEDFSNPLGQSMSVVSGTDTIVVKKAVQGKTSAWDQSAIEGVFFEIDVTNQVNYILANSGEFALAFLINMSSGGTGKVNFYGDQDAPGNLNSNEPWTKDGNTEHILVVGDLTGTPDAIEGVATIKSNSLALVNLPNPFNPSTTISYNLGNANSGSLKIFSATGTLVYSTDVSNSGSTTWNGSNVASGIYIARLEAGNNVISKQMILMK